MLMQRWVRSSRRRLRHKSWSWWPRKKCSRRWSKIFEESDIQFLTWQDWWAYKWASNNKLRNLLSVFRKVSNRMQQGQEPYRVPVSCKLMCPSAVQWEHSRLRVHLRNHQKECGRRLRGPKRSNALDLLPGWSPDSLEVFTPNWVQTQNLFQWRCCCLQGPIFDI